MTPSASVPSLSRLALVLVIVAAAATPSSATTFGRNHDLQTIDNRVGRLLPHDHAPGPLGR